MGLGFRGLGFRGLGFKGLGFSSTDSGENVHHVQTDFKHWLK